MLKYFPVLLLVCCSACEGNTAARKAARGANFVPDPNHLYFKNTRARHYRAEEITNRATIYRHDALFRSEARLFPVLIDNWLQDRAILRFETVPELPDWTLGPISESGQDKALTFSTPPTNEELDALITALRGEEALFLFSTLDSILPAFPDEAGRRYARTVVNDYLTLVGH